MIKVFSIMGGLLLSSPVWAYSYYGQHAVGWHWYEDPIEIEVQKALPLVAQPIDPIERIHKAQKTIERALDTAILEPTVSHVRAYLHLQNQLSSQSAQFAAIWQQVLLAYPELNFSLKHPTEGIALEVQKTHRHQQQDKAIKNLADHAGLFFFYKPSCPYCARFAPIVRSFAKDYGITVIPITLDGEVLAEFPDSKKDQGQAKQFGVKQTPALFVVNPKTQQALPVAYGLISEASLRERLVDSALVLLSQEERLP